MQVFEVWASPGRAKTAPKNNKRFHVDFGCIFAAFGVDVGALWAPKIVKKQLKFLSIF